MWNLEKLVSPETVLTQNLLTGQGVAENMRNDLGPHKPVDGTDTKNAPGDDRVNPVRQVFVNSLAASWGNVWSDNQVKGRQKEENNHRPWTGDWSLPGSLALVVVPLKPQQTQSNESVDDVQWIRNQVQHEVVSITWRWGHDGDDTHDPVLEKTNKWSVERFLGGEESGEWQTSLTAQLLDNSTLGENDRQDIAQGGEGDENRGGLFSALTKSVSEESRSHNSTRSTNLVSWHNSVVSNVYQHIKHGDGKQGSWSSDLQSSDWVLDLTQGVVGVGVTNVRPNNVVQSIDNSETGGCGAVEGIGEIMGVTELFGFDSTTQGDPTGDRNEKNNGNLENTKNVGQEQTGLDVDTVDDECKSNHTNTDSSGVPLGDFSTGGIEQKLTRDNRVTGSPTKEENVGCVHGGDEELGFLIDVLQVILLATVSGNSRTQLHVCEKTGEGDDGTNDPHNQ